jgi:hypothetical protein
MIEARDDVILDGVARLDTLPRHGHAGPANRYRVSGVYLDARSLGCSALWADRIHPHTRTHATGAYIRPTDSRSGP